MFANKSTYKRVSDILFCPGSFVTHRYIGMFFCILRVVSALKKRILKCWAPHVIGWNWFILKIHFSLFVLLMPNKNQIQNSCLFQINIFKSSRAIKPKIDFSSHCKDNFQYAWSLSFFPCFVAKNHYKMQGPGPKVQCFAPQGMNHHETPCDSKGHKLKEIKLYFGLITYLKVITDHIYLILNVYKYNYLSQTHIFLITINF